MGLYVYLPHTFLSDPRLKRHTPTSHHPLAKSSLILPTPSPSKITTWPPALRHVTKFLVPNPDFTRRIAHLIHTQHQHERQWWSGREALVQKLESREEGRRKLNDVLSVLLYIFLFFRSLSAILMEVVNMV